MSVRAHSQAMDGLREPSLRLLKQKVKRGYSGSIDADNSRVDVSDRHEQTIFSPQPPIHSRSEDSRSVSRYVEDQSAPTYSKQSTGTKQICDTKPSGELVQIYSPQLTKVQSTSGNDPSADEIIDMTQHEVGLDNLGNTCFMNSMLQCLLHVEPLVQFFLRPNFDTYVNLASPKKGSLATSFRQLVHEIYRKKQVTSVSPVNIQKAVTTHAPYLMDFQQQDSQEFLRFLLDGMSEDLCRKHSEKEVPSALTVRTAGIDVRNNSGSPGILPALPGAAAEFSRTAPAGLFSAPPQGNGNNAEDQANAAPLSVTLSGRGGGGGGVVAQRLREETRSMRQALPNEAGGTAAQSRARNNNQGEEEPATPSRAHTSGVSDSKLVNRLRKRTEQNTDADPSLGLGDSIKSSSNSDRVAPFSTVGSQQVQSAVSGEKAARSNAVVRMADASVDFSTDCSPTVSPGKGSGEHSIEESGYHHNHHDGAHNRGSHKSSSSVQRRLSKESDALVTELDAVTLASPGGVKSPGVSNTGVAAGAEALTPEKEAHLAWTKYLKLNDSIITDIFAGQLQSTIECLTCRHRSSTYDPFLDLSVPIYRDGDTTPSARRSFLGSIRSTVSGAASGTGSADSNKSTLEKCLEIFTAEETLDGDNMYACEKCKVKRKSCKQMTIFKYPQVLVLHIKRFKYNSTRREKLSTDVHFPLAGLDLTPFISKDLCPPASDAAAQGVRPVYDLIGVSNHHGSLHSGHYIAHVDTSGGRPDRARRWMCFNDARITAANASAIAGPTAYVLFYQLQKRQTPT